MSNNPPSFPMPSTGSGYAPSYTPSYATPSGPPPGEYAPPSGPPPGFPGSGGYAPSPGPPPSGYTPPPGPPPSSERGYPGQQYHHQHPNQSNNGYPGQGYRPPPGPPQMNYGPPPMPPSGEQHYGPNLATPGGHHQQQPFFQYSQCTGKKKALCIGINYFNTSSELRGCINDAKAMQRFLIAQFGYKEEDIVMLTDDSRHHRQIPTRDNIIHAMQWLVSGAQPNDSLFFHYSGHGGQTKDYDGDEADGYDEVIYPVDHETNGHIVDDMMHDIMVRPLPPGCRLTAIFDSCHSGSALDLPYTYSTEGKIKEPNLAAEAGQGLMSAVGAYARHDMGGVFKSVMSLGKTAMGGNQKASKLAKATRTSPADVISWSGCKDSQTSADTQEAGTSTGAMSFAFMTAILDGKQQSYQTLLVNIRNVLRAKYSQKPQLSSSHPIDVNVMFIC